MKNLIKPLIFTALGVIPSQALADCVVLLHGLARSESSFVVMEQVLENRGYQVVRPGYESTAFPVATLAERTLPAAIAECGANAPIHFVTHSMGGILLRQYFQAAAHQPPNLGATVMLGPPNQGSEVVDELGDWAVFGLINGPAGASLGTGAESLPKMLPPVDFLLGVIAGNQSVSPVFSALIPGEDDGKVSVDSTRVAGMQDHLVLPVTHTFMMNDPLVIAQVIAFLQQGRFDPDITWLDALNDAIAGTCIGTDCGYGLTRNK
ncbi:esterase/lipase family protein [Pseudophaeobacter arcticus]|uniref:esterase/lipase family protein n=1 Tax=Pseudophaeobacter arcticus TaxID=385492 RepID=UPI003A96F104